MTLTRASAVVIAVFLIGGLVRSLMHPGDRLPSELPALPPDDVFILDINEADAIEISLLPRVGPVLAERIVQHRRDHGPFRDTRDLLDVHGIGEKTLAKIEPYLQVSATETEELTPAGWAAAR